MNRILDVLREKNMKQIDLANALGVAKSSVSQWCSNTIQPPVLRLSEISNVLNCDITELLISNRNTKTQNETNK